MKRDIELKATVVAKFAVVAPVLDERSRRRWAAAESLAIGYGGDAVVRRPRVWLGRRFARDAGRLPATRRRRRVEGRRVTGRARWLIRRFRTGPQSESREHVPPAAPLSPVGSGAGAPPVEGRWMLRRFRSGPQSDAHGHVSSSRLVKPRLPLYGTGLSCWLLASATSRQADSRHGVRRQRDDAENRNGGERGAASDRRHRVKTTD